MSYFLPNALAQENATTAAITSTPASGSAPGMEEAPPAWFNIVPLLVILVVFYFLMIRPQNKRYKAHKAMQDGVERGDDIITNGGIIGKITKVQDDGILHIEIAENTVVKLQRGGINTVLNKKNNSANAA